MKSIRIGLILAWVGFLSLVLTACSPISRLPLDNQSPVAKISANPIAGEAPLEVTFDGSKSYDPGGDEIVSYKWEFGDGGTADGKTVQHLFDSPGSYTVQLTVSATNGTTGASKIVITSVKSYEGITNPEGISSFIYEETEFKVQVTKANGSPLSNITTYLQTDGQNAVVSLIDESGKYIPRIGALGESFEDKELDTNSLTPEVAFSYPKDYVLHTWDKYVKGGSNLVYDDRLPEWIKREEILKKRYAFWRGPIELKELDITLGDIAEHLIDEGADWLVTCGLGAIPYVGPYLGWSYRAYTYASDLGSIYRHGKNIGVTARLRGQGYTDKQEFEIWKVKSKLETVTGKKIKMILVLPLEYPNQPSSQNRLPVAHAGSGQTVIDRDHNGSEQVTLDGSKSNDPDDDIVSYVWTENGTEIATGISPTVTLSIGEHIITLTVTDDDGHTDLDKVVITVQPGVINFPDPNLEQAIRDAINKKPTEDIYLSDLEGLTNLDASDRGISDLRGISHCKNLKNLDLSQNNIRDIKYLVYLTNLEHLELSHNHIEDLGPVATLTNLVELGLWDNDISNIGALEILSQLRRLNLGKNNIDNIQPLVNNSGLGHGDEIDIRYNKLDLSEGSDDMQDIQTLRDREITVAYKPQKGVTLPDLTVTSVALSKSSAKAGELVSVTFTLENNGGPVSKEFQNRIFLSTTQYGGDGQQIPIEEFPMSLDGTASKTKTVEVTIPQVPKGDWYMAVYTDCDEIIDESEEGNNINSAEITIGEKQSPRAAFDASSTSGPAPLTVDFDASISTDPDGTIEEYAWDFGDGNTGSGKTTTHTYNSEGTYTATLTVTDNDELTDQASEQINVTSGPIFEIVEFDVPSTAKVNTQITIHYAVKNTGDEEGTRTITLTIEDSAGKKVHQVSQDKTISSGAVFSEDIQHTFANADEYTVILDTQDDQKSARIQITTGPEEPVNFPDPNLEQAVREAIDKPTGPIYPSDLEGLTKLKAVDNGITNLSGLEYCDDLVELDLGGDSPGSNNISDISPLSNLTNLQTLNLGYNNITDISPLSNLTNLQTLVLGANNISDISPLSNLTNLQSLWLWNNNISDISPLPNLTNLQMLDLNDNSLSDIQPLSNLTNLQVLYLWINNISDISPLASLTNLDWLYLGRNNISDIQPLVENSGLGDGDEIELQNNYLDLSEGSEDMQNIQTLIDRGAAVKYKPQKIEPEKAQLSLTLKPSPALFNTDVDKGSLGWRFTMKIEEVAGLGVQLTEIREKYFNPQGDYLDTFKQGEANITALFESSRIDPKKALSTGLVQPPWRNNQLGSIKIIVSGIDDHGNEVQASAKVYLGQNVSRGMSIEINPTPIPLTEEGWQFEVTATELNGNEVSLSGIELTIKNENSIVQKRKRGNASEIQDGFGTNHLSANSSITTEASGSYDPSYYMISYLMVGTDNNGNEVYGTTGLVPLEQEGGSSQEKTEGSVMENFYLPVPITNKSEQWSR